MFAEPATGQHVEARLSLELIEERRFALHVREGPIRHAHPSALLADEEGSEDFPSQNTFV